MLTFLGRGSAFSNKHNCAYFKENNDLVLLDCSCSVMSELKKLLLTDITNIYILVTHLHGDHINGIGTFMHMIYWTKNKIPFTVVVPTASMLNKLKIYLTIEGCETKEYNIITTNDLNKKWFNYTIETSHVSIFEHECFGYDLTISNTHVVYTGDTNILSPFIMNLKKGDYLYTECSSINNNCHLYWYAIKDFLVHLSNKGIHIRLMHIDNEDFFNNEIKSTNIKFAKTTYEKTQF